MIRYPIQYPHGIMFHHFHNEVHPRGQGSISSEEFERVILFIGTENIISAPEWCENYGKGDAIKDKVCITFDDSLKCQYEIAKPILDKYNIKAFFFVYSSVLNGGMEYLEIFRYFRSKYFSNFDNFYEAFMEMLLSSEYADEVRTALKVFNPDEYLKNFSFYSENDKIFRYTRDHILKTERYNSIVLKMIEKKKLSVKEIAKNLWMSSEEVADLSVNGHVIGLHSESHPTTMGLLNIEKQKSEYQSNKDFLERLLSKKIETMSHPCNSYSSETLQLLKNMGVKVGFRANMELGYDSVYEIPRQDHIIVLRMLEENQI